jgi:hypothetical protein
MDIIAIPVNYARLNITWGGQNADLPDPILADADPEVIKQTAAEAVRTGSVPGISFDPDVNFENFVVERFEPNEAYPYKRICVRPKVPFGE